MARGFLLSTPVRAPTWADTGEWGRAYAEQQARLELRDGASALSGRVASADNPEPASSEFRQSFGEDPYDLNTAIQRRIDGLGVGLLKRPRAIVLHQTGGHSASAAIDTMAKDKIGTHYLIDKDGTIYQLAGLDQWTYHVGRNIKSRSRDEGTADKSTRDIVGIPQLNRHERRKEYPARYPISEESIGIEVVSAYTNGVAAMEPPTPEQAVSIRKLVRALKKRYALGDGDVFTHSQISYKDGQEGKGIYTPGPVNP